MNFKEIIDQLDDFACVVVLLFALAIVIQLFYYLIVYLRVVFRKPESKTLQMSEMPPVSVIICARNEAENLSHNLIHVLEQEYPSFEVIAVNVCSVDDTEEILADLKLKYPHLRSTIIKRDGSFPNLKKFAETVGIRAAQNEWLLFTDADCKPESKHWIASMSRYFIEKKGIVLGYGGYSAQKGLLNKWIRYDTCFTALQYFGFAKLGKAYTGMGRNLAYRKSLFLSHNGFALHAHILTGDDDLVVNKAANRRNVAATHVFESQTRSVQKITFKEWVWQKSKHITSSMYYSGSQIFWLTLEPLSRTLMWITFCVLMFIYPFWYHILILFALRMLIFILIIGAATKRFNERSILKYALLFDLVMPFVYLHIFILNRISSKYSKWK